MCAENGRAVWVEVEAGGETQQVYGKRITLSAGAVASPVLCPVLPRMVDEGIATIGFEILCKLTAFLFREACANADMMQRARIAK